MASYCTEDKIHSPSKALQNLTSTHLSNLISSHSTFCLPLLLNLGKPNLFIIKRLFSLPGILFSWLAPFHSSKAGMLHRNISPLLNGKLFRQQQSILLIFVSLEGPSSINSCWVDSHQRQWKEKFLRSHILKLIN